MGTQKLKSVISSGISKLVILTQSSVDFGDQECRPVILRRASCLLEILPRESWPIPEFVQNADVRVNACLDNTALVKNWDATDLLQQNLNAAGAEQLDAQDHAEIL
jgi:hypothetical protein